MNFLINLTDFFLPRLCPSCKSKLNTEEKVVCRSCLNKIKIASDDRITLEFNKKYAEKNFISGFTALYIFEKDKELQNIIHNLKYNQRFLIGKFLGEMIGITKKRTIESWEIGEIVPIPLHTLKKAARGYNQSLYIAKGIGRQLSIPVNSRSVIRKKNTLTQTKMNLSEREKNISGAFKLKYSKVVKGKNILIADDVITTGATTGECARVLLEGGAAKVYAVSAAIAD